MRRLALTAVVVALLGLAGSARADDKAKADSKDVTGTWTWTVERGGQSFDVTLKLKQDGDKVTGTISGRQGTETKIEDGKCKDGEVCFKVTRERQGQKFTQTYKGKVEGNTIKGNVEFERNGETQKRDWEAMRKTA